MPYEGGVEAVQFASGDARLVGVLYPALGKGPRPAAVLLHGVPGSEKNWDLAYRLRELGWHTLVPSFRGSWGSGGDCDLARQPEDAVASIDFLLGSTAEWEVDLARVALVGYSLGSRAALVAAYRDPRVAAVVSIAGVYDFDEVMLDDSFYTNAAPFLRGIDQKMLKTQWGKLGGRENPSSIIGELKRPLLIVHGDQDEVMPYYMGPALHRAGGQWSTFLSISGADHTFSRHRAELVNSVSAWLKSTLDNPA